MDQTTFGFDPKPKKTHNEVFFAEMNRVVPWVQLVVLIAQDARSAH